MTTHAKPHSQSGTAHKSESQEPHDKGRAERNLREVSGEPADNPTSPESRETGYKGESNVGEDLTSGDG